MALYARPDVAELMGSQGYHGFYIDLRKCHAPAEEASISVVASDGTPLPGAPLVASIPEFVEDHDRIVLFMHIPKTAGTALRESIEPNFRMSEVAYLYPDPALFPPESSVWALTLEQRAGLRFVMGHFLFGIHNALPGRSEYVTVLRDPRDRVLSQYFQYAHYFPERLQDGARRLGPCDVLEKRLDPGFDNLMVRFFSGMDATVVPPGSVDRSVCELALHNMHTHFAHIGFQDSLDDMLNALNRRYKWHKTLPLQQVNTGYWDRENLDLPLIDKAVKHFERWDVLLYERARQLYARKSATRPPCSHSLSPAPTPAPA